jgi:hypothetical protein
MKFKDKRKSVRKKRGITKQYDPDYYSIISLIRPENAGQMEGAWHYSSGYWQTKNLDYYSPIYPVPNVRALPTIQLGAL